MMTLEDAVAAFPIGTKVHSTAGCRFYGPVRLAIVTGHSMWRDYPQLKVNVLSGPGGKRKSTILAKNAEEVKSDW